MNTLNRLKQAVAVYQSYRDRWINAGGPTGPQSAEVSRLGLVVAEEACSYLDARRERRKKENRRQRAASDGTGKGDDRG